ncbi:MAG: hypothetical protein WC621_04005 [Patescibacteria group bacterium]
MPTTLLASLLGLILSLNLWLVHSLILGLLVGFAYLWLTGTLWSERLKLNSWLEKFVIGSISLMAAVIIISTIGFYIGLFNKYLIGLLLVALPLAGQFKQVKFTLLRKRQRAENDQPVKAGMNEDILRSLGEEGYAAEGSARRNMVRGATSSLLRPPKEDGVGWVSLWNSTLAAALAITWQKILTLTLFIILAGLTSYSLYYVLSNEALRTPWQVVLPITFALYAGAVAAWLIVSRYFKAGGLILLYLISSSVLPLVYALGYGFDPFIHQATAKILANTGTIDPKPLYYIGQYVIVVIINWVTALPINLIDKWLLPILTSLILPVLTVRKLKQTATDNYLLVLAGALPLIFLLSQFTYTTPQGLANLLALVLIFTWFKNNDGVHLPIWFSWLVALAGVAVHPLTGLPLLGLNTIWQIYQSNLKLNIKKWLLGLAATATALVVPLGFAVMSWLKPSAASIKLSFDWWNSLARLGSNLAGALPILPPYTEVADVVYLWGRPLVLIIVALAAWGWYRTSKYRLGAGFLITSFGLLTLSYLLLNLFAKFPNLPTNEQNFYAARLWELALFTLWPLALYGGYQIIHYVWYERRAPYLVSVSLVLILTASFYLTYPRLDVYHRDTGYNTTPDDVQAVKLINNVGANGNYAVLANQAVAAAAIKTYSFNKYFGQNFYYPLPTGTNPLYQVYLNAAERGLPTRATIKTAADITGAPQIFLVLNKYWANFDKLTVVADSAANQKWLVGDGRIAIYRYDFK